MSGQLTFGAVMGLETIVPVSEHRDDLVECVDSRELHPRDECHKDVNGDYWSDIDNLCACDDCGGLVDCDDVRDNYCPECWKSNYVECESCNGSVRRGEHYTDEGGDDYCGDCYYENYTSCDGCSCELHREGRDIRHNSSGEAFCSDCWVDEDDEEFDPKYNWTGRKVYAKVGSERKFGVEIETSESERYRGYTERLGWGAKDDGSVNGKEFVSPILYGDDGLASVEEMCEELRGSGCKVDRSCGLHVHLDINDTDEGERGRIALAYHYTREFWFDCVAESRRDNTYCRRDDDTMYGVKEFFDRDDCINGTVKPRSRYCWINFRAYESHGTVEVRLHHGTLDGREVCNWIKVHARFIDYVKDLTVNQITRIFGKKSKPEILRELRALLKDTDLADYYGRKAGVV